jgi:extracellular elastinolytic metalloproteinase
MEMNRRAVDELWSNGQSNKGRAYAICWQAVVDGLKLTRENPSFLEARDAIFLALDDLLSSNRITSGEYSAVRRAAWTAFAKFGMGRNATSQDAGFGQITEDTSLPDNL